jgi:hypothetical protein
VKPFEQQPLGLNLPGRQSAKDALAQARGAEVDRAVGKFYLENGKFQGHVDLMGQNLLLSNTEVLLLI